MVVPVLFGAVGGAAAVLLTWLLSDRGIGTAIRMRNRHREWNESEFYTAVAAVRDGKRRVLLITDSEWRRMEGRGIDQPEDVPAKWGGKAR